MEAPTVLVVEDDDDIRDTVSEVLARAGYTIATAGNGREALDYLERAPQPRCVLLDLMMPVMDGWEFMAAVRQQQSLAALRVVIVTGARVDIPEGAMRILHKPVGSSELLAAVRQVCAATGSSARTS